MKLLSNKYHLVLCSYKLVIGVMYFTASLFSEGCPRLLGKEEIHSKNYILKCTNSSSEKQRLSKSCTIKVWDLKTLKKLFRNFYST